MARQPKRPALARERKRRTRRDDLPRTHASVAAATTRRDAAVTCAWCGSAIEVKATGRIPKWCSATCRQRAWEQSRAAAAGLAAVEVVERVIEVPTRIPRHGEWPAVLRELTAQLDDGRLYTRDLPDLGPALSDLAAAYNRRQTRRRHRP